MNKHACALLCVLALSACTAPLESPSPSAADSKVKTAGAAARVEELVLLSGPSPFAPQGCGQTEQPVYAALPDEVDDGDGFEFGDEGDPSIAVDPSDPKHLVAAWHQDAALGVIAAASFDGGRSWRSEVVPSLTHCADMAEERVFHSRLGFGPDGLVYLGNEADDGLFPDPRQLASIRVAASVSRDGGLHWQTGFVDDGIDRAPKGFSTLATEPDVAGTALVAWHTEGRVPGGTTYVSRTVDGGASWTRHTARQGLQAEFPFNRIVALRNGTLLLFSADLRPSGYASALELPGAPPATAGLFLQVSRDKAVTWSEPVAVATSRGQQWPGVVEAPDGSVYLSWLGPDDAGAEVQFVSRSDDGGASWTSPVIAVARTDDIHAPLAVSGRGDLGFVYTRPSASGLQDERDAWLAYSTDRGATWQELHIAGPFTLRGADLPTFQETAGTPDGFVAVFLAGPPLAHDGNTDVMFVSIKLK